MVILVSLMASSIWHGLLMHGSIYQFTPSVAWTCRSSWNGKAAVGLFGLVLGSHHGTALVLIPKRSTSP